MSTIFKPFLCLLINFPEQFKNASTLNIQEVIKFIIWVTSLKTDFKYVKTKTSASVITFDIIYHTGQP